MHFEITMCKIFFHFISFHFILGKGLPPYRPKKSYTYIHLDEKRGIFSLPIVEFSYARGAVLLQSPNQGGR